MTDLFQELEVYLTWRIGLPGRAEALRTLGVAPSEVRLLWERDFWREKAIALAEQLAAALEVQP